MLRLAAAAPLAHHQTKKETVLRSVKITIFRDVKTKPSK